MHVSRLSSCQHPLPGHQSLHLRPQPRVSTHQHPFWTTGPVCTPNTCFHPPALVSTYGCPLSTHQNLFSTHQHPFLRFRHHGSFWTCQDLFTPTATSLMPSTSHLTISMLCLLALYINICLFAAPSQGLSRFCGKEVSFRTLRIQVPISFT
jgi:hypothetical protein